MQGQLTVIVPFWNGHGTIQRLLDSLPSELPAIIVDDVSDEPLAHVNRPNTKIVRMPKKGYFSGAVNAGAKACATDFVIVNQDAWFTGDSWLKLVSRNRQEYGTFGHGVMNHAAWPNGYVQGTFMFVRRDTWNKVGGFNERDYPLWGSTAEWQLRMCRAGFKALPLAKIAGFHHDEHRRRDKRRYGESITSLLHREGNERRAKLLDTPPLMSVVVPCYNYGHYLDDAINSLIGGPTSLGDFPPQSFQSFEVIIVDDASTDDSWKHAQRIADDWKGIRAIRLPKNRGTPGCMNAGVRAAVGRYIHILSADDMREPWQLERLLRAAQENPHSFAFSSVMVFKDGERTKELELPEYDFDRVLKRNLVPAGIVYPKVAWEQIGGYPEIMVHGREDWAFNVGLGVNGWCGIKVDGFGNLYRRERQNRSWRTGNKHKNEPPSPDAVKWRKFFQAQMESLYPGIYEGDRPMGCCPGSSKKSSRISSSGRSAQQVSLPGQKGMIILRYVGGSRSTKTFWANQTQYRFGGKRTRGYVAREDVDALKEQYPRQFVEEPRKPPSPPPLPSKAPEPEPPEPELTAGQEVQILITDELKDAQPPLTSLAGIGPALAQKLSDGGYDTIESIAAAVPGELSEVKGVTFSRAMTFIESAREACSANA